MIQWIIVFIVIAFAVTYAALRIYSATKHAKNHCDGCRGCSLYKEISKNKAARRMKTRNHPTPNGSVCPLASNRSSDRQQ